MDFQKVMTMIDDISQHLPEQKYIEIVNNLKKEYDNANDNANDDDYCELIENLFHQLEYDLYYYIKKKIILFKDDDIDELIDMFLYNHSDNIRKITWFHTEDIEDTIKNDMIWDFIEIVNCKKNIIEKMDRNRNGFYYGDLQDRDTYINLFDELALESALLYFKQEFQTEKYIDRCWSRINENYENTYYGCYGYLENYEDMYYGCYDYLDITDIQFPKDYFDGMTESEEYLWT